MIEINNRSIGAGRPVYIVAEMSANHGQDFDRAVRIIKAAKEAGADAIKLQTYTPKTMTIDCDEEHFRIKGTLWDSKTLFELYGEAFTPWEWQPELQKIAQQIGLDFFSAPFDESSVDFLERLNVPVYKIASFEGVDLPLLRKVAKTGKPVILSTGMMTLDEIGEAVTTLREAGNTQLSLLKCTSAYPAPPKEMNLRTIPHLSDLFGVPVGISDHTLGTAVPVAAVSLGASIIEKHFTISRALRGADSAFSLEPAEFKVMVEAVRTAEEALGVIYYGLNPHEKASVVFRRSLFVTEDVASGELFTSENVRSIRPGIGLHTRHLPEILGSRAGRNIKRGTPLAWNLIAGNSKST